MSNSQRKGSSVAAFLFMPQFGLCFENLRLQLIPVFVQIIAAVFVSAAILPKSHPALMYGQRDSKKYSFIKLIGEAWFNLRTTNATTYQWGMFASVMMMLAMMLSALGTFFMKIFFNFGAVAQAQIFNHPADPYGTGGTTDLGAVGSMGVGSNILFDTRYSPDFSSPAGASTDYALMVLDKVLRQGAIGTGGALQNALGSMLQVYNTGILIVASVILFWMILTIVVDTAKTGVVGGGRHNMVWAPIRIVFALGIMIPLGASGFSSGQYMVMKLAEWGSNFATRGWSSYVTGVINDENLFPAFRPESVNGVVYSFARIKTCQVAYNAYVYESTAPNPDHIIQVSTGNIDYGRGIRYNNYSNATQKMLCGGVSFPIETGDVGRLLRGVGLANSKFLTFFGGSGSLSMLGPSNDFRDLMRGAVTPLVDEISNPGSPFIEASRDFACAFVLRRYSDGGGGTNIVPTIPDCVSADFARCGGSATQDPTVSCHEEMRDMLLGQVSSTYGDPASGVGAISQVKNYVVGPMAVNMASRGWGGMGSWYQDISLITALTYDAQEIPVTVYPGYLWGRDSGTGIEHKAFKITGPEYTRWWDTVAAQTATTNPANVAGRKIEIAAGAPNSASISDLKDNIFDAKQLGNFVASLVAPNTGEWFLFDVIDNSDDQDYPLSTLSSVGNWLLGYGTTIVLAISVLQTVSSIAVEGGGSFLGFGISGGGSLGAGFATSGLANGIYSIGMILIGCGIMLAYYLPILPLIRVSFSVLTWIISVFEAVIMVPIAALAHLTSEGDGLAGAARGAWILWLNVLLRPVLVVAGFIGAMLVYNAFIVYFHAAFTAGAAALATNSSLLGYFISKFAYSVIYVAIMYTTANTVFKMLDTIPNGMARWMGGHTDPSFDQDNSAEMLMTGSNLIRSFQRTPGARGGLGGRVRTGAAPSGGSAPGGGGGAPTGP